MYSHPDRVVPGLLLDPTSSPYHPHNTFENRSVAAASPRMWNKPPVQLHYHIIYGQFELFSVWDKLTEAHQDY